MASTPLLTAAARHPDCYHAPVATLVLTVIGDDRAGLVTALAQTIAAQGGNWERSQLAELAGKFAGIVVVSIPDSAAESLTAALRPLTGLLEITVHPGASTEVPGSSRDVTIDLLGNDHPGIVRDVTAALARHSISIDTLTSETVDAPWAGGRLFQAHIAAPVPDTTDLAALRTDLEHLAAELQVDITLDS